MLPSYILPVYSPHHEYDVQMIYDDVYLLPISSRCLNTGCIIDQISNLIGHNNLGALRFVLPKERIRKENYVLLKSVIDKYNLYFVSDMDDSCRELLERRLKDTNTKDVVCIISRQPLYGYYYLSGENDDISR